MILSVKTKLDHVLAVLGEECGEVQQAIGKITRFGFDDNNQPHNWSRLRAEVHDIIAAYEMVCLEYGESSDIDRSLVENKKAKVKHYMTVASDGGTLE